MQANQGIHALPTAELVRLARAIAREDFAEKVSRAALVLAKFGHLESELDVLVGHEKRAALAIVTAILRERERAPAFRANVTWSGPHPTGQGTREPYELLVELIATAERSVLFAGVDFERDMRLLRSLHAAQRGRGLEVSVILAENAADLVARAHDLFASFQPWPALYVPDPSRVHRPLPVCLMTDETRFVVMAGAAPEVEAPDTCVTTGVLVEDPHAAAALHSQWRTLIDTGVLLPLSAAEPPTA
ncbi:MAG TPA: hypothetical protein VMF89_19365 [Polyangiales bacterium]|nr:hypothetical protein [Polyangiales bacterium]